MNNNFVSGLIQMNSQMVKPDWSIAAIIIGAITFFFILILLFAKLEAIKDKKKKIGLGGLLCFIIPIILAATCFFMGLFEPMVKEIRACASGPVSIEEIATRYEIVKMNGKELILRER